MTAMQSKARRNYVVYLSQAMHDGAPVWHYILVDRLKLPLLLSDAKHKPVIDLARYGRIIFSGMGEQPPASISQYICKNYNVS